VWCLGKRCVETTARSLTTIAELVDRHARQLGNQGLDHATYFRMGRYYCSQRAAVVADNDGAIALFEFRETAQLIEDINGRL